VNGWDLVDVSTPRIVGVHLLDRLAFSPSVWERRIAIMATFAFVRAGECNETLRLARVLLEDEHDLIHKAVGWMLREVGKRDEVLLVGFLHQHAGEMPRTMLRYAVERLDVSLRTELVAGRATSAPPVGRDLGPLGINLAEFVRRYNDATRDQDGEIVPAVVTVYEDRSFDMVTKTPTTAYLLRRAAGLEKGSGTPGRDGASAITEEQLRKIAETKMPDLNASSVESAMKVVAVTARSMGIRVGR
jgi:large subunit ribosomal protein L11